jgi:hypothetical protein
MPTKQKYTYSNDRHTVWSRLSGLVLVPLLALAMVSCDMGDFGDMNENPTQSTELDDRYIITTTQKAYAGNRGWITRANFFYSATITQQIARGAIAPGEIYTRNVDYATALWGDAYSGGWQAQVRNIQDIIKILERKQEDGENVANRMAIARIMRVLIFQRITDLYGDAPYFEAGLGFHEGIFSPRYDPQEEIYNDMFNELDQAVNMIGSPTPDDYTRADLVYDGDLDQWQRFGNSLRLRLALRLVKVDEARAQQEAEAAINHAAGVMQSNDDNWTFPHEVGPGVRLHSNANAESYIVEPYYLSQTLVDWMLDTEDPRLRVYGAVVDGDNVNTDPAVQQGRPNGYTDGELEDHPRWPGDLTDYTALHPRFLDLEQPSVWFTYAEVELMQAEAAVRWNSSPLDAAQHYYNGVEAAMSYLTVYSGNTDISPAEIADYQANNPFPVAGTPDEQLEQINTQYWAATFLNFIESWINFRRSGYPDLEPAPVDDPNPHPNSDTNGEFPTRLFYPPSEELLNAENYQEVINRQGPDDLTTRVWWDVAVD